MRAHPKIHTATDYLDELWSGFREIGWPWSVSARVDIAVNRSATVARGVIDKIPILHPGYPETREHWLSLIDWQWQDWVRDIADYVEFRGLMGFRPLTGRLMAERVANGMPTSMRCWHEGQAEEDALLKFEAGSPYPWHSNSASSSRSLSMASMQ